MTDPEAAVLEVLAAADWLKAADPDHREAIALGALDVVGLRLGVDMSHLADELPAAVVTSPERCHWAAAVIKALRMRQIGP